MRRKWISLLVSMVLALWLVLVLTTLALAYTERITNGTFATNVNGWSNFGTGGSIVHEASIGHTATGSAKVTNASGQNTSSGAVQCVDIPLSGGTSYYTVKGWIYVPSGQPTNFSYAYIRVQYYSNDNCSGSLGDTIDSNSVTDVDSWREAVKITLAPTNAQSAQVRLYIRTTGAGGSPYVYFDDVTFYDSNANVVTLSSLTAASSLPAALPVPGLVTLGGLAAVAVLGLGAGLVRRRR